MVTLVPDTAVLDDLELLRNGLLGPQRVGPQELVQVPLTGLEVPAGTTTAQVTDAEGVALALLPLAGSPAGPQGAPAWQGRRSARPFEELHLLPDQLPPARTVVVTDRPATVEELARRAGTGRVRVLVLASTDGDERDQVDAVRSARAFAATHPDADVVVAPLHPGTADREEKRRRVVAAYGRDADVVELPPAGERPTQPRATGTVLFLTGLSGSGKSTIARAVRNRLLEEGRTVTFLDGDLVRRHLSAGLGFGQADRDRNIRRIGWVAAEVAAHGGIAICSPIAPYERTRADVRDMVRRRGGRFVLVHVATPLAECERRDRKGLYARARRGEIPDFTGISAPYETPHDPDLRVDTTGADLGEVRDAVLALLTPRPDEGDRDHDR